MTLAVLASRAAERLPVPDLLTRIGIATMVGRTRRRLLAETDEGTEAAFALSMHERPIAEATAIANTQHYELPPAFFALVLGPLRKYSSCLYAGPDSTLAEAELLALEETAAHARLADGQEILELGCGWGSLSLWMAERYPAARITAVSNSRPQRLHIEAEAALRGLGNLRVITADMNDFAAEARFDRIVSVEMFEHMANWPGLLTRLRGWLRPDGLLFLHVFTHRSTPYRFETTDPDDWIARHFFTGGLMPSHGLLRHFGGIFALVADWRWSGSHYARTARDWLANFDARSDQVQTVLRDVYGAQTPLWTRRWRLFFLATAGLFGHAGGAEWGVSHYLLRPVQGAVDGAGA
jgi:cyclopropane-fatty-acyl-phospholipid synthase